MSYNRAYNSHNPNQGPAKRVLCLCSAGLLRSPTAAHVLHKEFGYNTRSAGVEVDFALIPLDNVLLGWAQEVVCMSQYQASIVKDMLSKTDFNLQVPIYCLEVPDTYGYMDKTLQKLILKAYSKAIGDNNGSTSDPKASRSKRTGTLRPAKGGVHGRIKPKPRSSKSV